MKPKPGRSQGTSRRSWWKWALVALAVLIIATPVLAVVGVVQLLDSTSDRSSDEVDEPGVKPYVFVDLDTSLGFGWGSATWSVGAPLGWEFTIRDRQGVTRAEDPALECIWTTRRLTRSDSIGEYGDRAASSRALEQLVAKFRAGSPEATVTYLLPVAVEFSSDTRAGSAEFLAARIDDVDPTDGSPRSTLVTARAMPYLSEFMFTVLTCPRDRIELSPSKWVGLVANTAIVPSG